MLKPNKRAINGTPPARIRVTFLPNTSNDDVFNVIIDK
jgi:hypothetical protein